MPKYAFGEITVDTDTIEILGPDGHRDVEPQVFNVLRYLIEQAGRLVTKEELLDNVWGNRFVSESALTTRIKQSRRAVGDDGRTQWAIKTVHGRGYRFIAETTVATESPLAQQVAAVSTTRTTTSPLPAELVVDTRERFVGRQPELEQAVRLLTASSTASPFGWIWLLGEPGIGKTRLAAEVAREAQALGHRVVFGRNNEDLRVPHQPFIEIMRAVIDDLDDAELATYAQSIPPELAPLLPPRVAVSPAERRAASVTDTATLQYQLFEAMARWLIATADASPLTMIIDDLHWASDSTVQLLTHLQQRPEGGPINVVITARDTAPDINQRVTNLLALSQGAPNTEILRLEGLSDVEARAFVGDEAVIEDVMRQTAGNPLLLQAVNPADGSVDIESAVHRRLASLDNAVHTTLQVASILGLEFELRLAAAATGRDELDVLDELEQAIASRLLNDVGADRFRFTHALVRSSLRNDLSSARQARLHLRVAEGIESLFPDDRRHLPALAFHTAVAAQSQESLRPLAIERLEAAADESMSQLSFDDAADALRQALDLLDGAQEDQRRRAALMIRLGEAQTRSGASTTGARTLASAIAAARATDDPLQLIEASLRHEDAIWRPGMSSVDALDYLDEANRRLDAMVAESAVANEQELRTRLAIAHLRASAIAGKTDQARSAFPRAHDLARSLGSADQEASLLNVYLSQVLFFQQSDTSAPLVERLAELQPSIDDGDIALHAVHVRLLHVMLHPTGEDTRHLQDLMTHLQTRARSAFWRFIRVNQEAMEAFYLGDLDEAEALAERCLDLASELPEEDGSGTFGLRMFMIRREQDQLSQIAPLVRRVLTTGDVSGVWTPGLALIMVETGTADEAAELLDEIKAARFAVPIDAMWSTVFVFLIESFVALGDTDACLALHSRFKRLSGTNVVTGSGLLSFGSADRYLGMLSFVVGDLDAAEESLGHALEVDSAGGSSLWANESRLWLSRVRRAQGHTEEADAMLQVIRQQAQAGGLARLARLAATGASD